MPTPWTERELATLAAIAETFVRGDALRRARLVTEALERAADPEQIGQLRLVLRALESRLANAVLGAGPTTFSAMIAGPARADPAGLGDVAPRACAGRPSPACAG